MSYNGSGTFQINTSGQPVVTGTVISSSAFNALTADLATGLSTAITKDGQTTTTARIPFAQGINSSLATDTTNGSSGSIYTAGGVGITKALYVGTNATVVGTLGVTGAATFSATPIFSALTASSAVATDASKNLVSVTNTGTGNNVLATSPTLVTPALGTPASGVVTNLTGTASININGTVGATTPATGSFTSLAYSTTLTGGTGIVNLGSGQFYKDASGNVGIGGAPTQKLDVYGGAGAAISIIRAASGQNAFFSVGGNGNTFLSTSFDIVQDSANLAQIAQRANAPLAFSTNNTERMRIDSSGYLLVNQTSNTTSSYVQIYGAQPALSVENTSTGAVNQIIIRNPNGTVGSISTSGSSTAFNTSSDYRLKNTIAPMTGALEKVALLKPCTYKWNVDGSDGQGFIAHELDEVVPGCVTGDKDAVDSDGNPVYQGIDVSFLVATLTAAIQELKAEFDAYKATHP